ncbi:MAG: ABC transporter permease [Deltaproteobacteria bacterium]|nr:ABC transporter permease [Deltaproteobacteria bacterium]
MKVIDLLKGTSALRVSPLIILLILWEVAARTVERFAFFYGAPSRILSNLVAKTADGSLIVDTGITATEILVGFVLGNLVGSLLGLSFWYEPRVAYLVRPYVVVIGSIPVLALAPIIIIWFGIGIWAKIIVVALSTVAVATTQAFTGAENADPKHIQLLASYGSSRSTIFRKVVIPSSMTWLFAAYKLNVGTAILGAFIAEFIAAEAGLGNLIIRSMGLFDTSMVLTGVLVLCFLSLAITDVVGRVQRRVMPWT